MSLTRDIDSLIEPYGGQLINLFARETEREQLKERAGRLPSIQLSDRAMCDLELLATGGFSPLDRFMGKEDHQRVMDEMRLTSGHLFPIPITLTVQAGPEIKLGTDIALRSPQKRASRSDDHRGDIRVGPG